MGKTISLFPDYSHKENRTTNYCLLLLKMIYEENPKILAEIISGLIGYDISEDVGVKFRQQESKKASVIDGLICQRSFTIYIETKNADQFDDAQLENHLEALKKEGAGLKVLIALGKFEDEHKKPSPKINEKCENTNGDELKFSAISFDDLVNAIEAIEELRLSKHISDAVQDLRGYLEREELLLSWPNLLDVINCAGYPNDVLKDQVYICPVAGGAYSHRRCKYFGMYSEKQVKKLALIKAVIDVESKDHAELLWKNVVQDESVLLKEAKDKVVKLRPGKFPNRIFLLGELYDTSFTKDSWGGMFGSKRYFDISKFKVQNVAELADTLEGKEWSELKR